MSSTQPAPSVMPRPRELLLAVSVIAVAVLFCFRELTANPTHLLVGSHRGGENDLTSYFLRTLDWPREKLSEGKFPGWNSHLLLGGPTWGNPQSLLFYPPNWICWWLGSSAASWLMVAHHWWAGIGAYLWARSLGVRPTSALIAGAIGAVAPYAVGHTAEGHYPQTCMMAWLPWTLWAFERFLASQGRQWLAVSVCLAMCFLSGHVQEVFYLVLLMSGTLALGLLIRAFRHLMRVRKTDEKDRVPALRSDALRVVAGWTLVGTATLGLVLIDLLPTFANSRLSVRASGLPLSMAGDGLSVKHVALLWNTQALEHKSSGGAVWPWETNFHFGVIPAVLVLLALLLGNRRPATRRLLWMLAVTVLFAFGTSTPFFRWCHAWLPGVASFRSPARALYLSSALVSVLAAVGWDVLCDRWVNETASRRRLLAGLSLLLMAGLTFELGRFSERVVATVPASALRRDSAVSEFLRAHQSSDRVLSGLGLYDDREAQQDHTQKLLGYDPFLFLRYAQFFEALTRDGAPADPAGFQLPRLRDFQKPLLDLAGVRFAVMPSSGNGIPLEVPGWKQVHAGRIPQAISLPSNSHQEWPFAILENQSVMPRTFVVGHAVTAKDAVAGESPSKHLRRLELRETVLLSADHWQHDAARAAFAEAQMESYSDDEIRIAAHSDGHGYLVLTDLFHPGWKATVDGQPSPIIPANLAFRAVPLSPGDHSIVFRFTVPGSQVAAVVSAISWLAVLVMLAVGRASSRSREEPLTH